MTKTAISFDKGFVEISELFKYITGGVTIVHRVQYIYIFHLILGRATKLIIRLIARKYHPRMILSECCGNWAK